MPERPDRGVRPTSLTLTLTLTLTLVSALASGCAREREAPPPRALSTSLPAVDVAAFIHPGDRPLPVGALKNPYAGNGGVARQGAALFVQMNCDGCHGDGGTGSVGPNLADARFQYGASDAALFQSIYQGRPNGMPAWGTILGPDVVWRLVTYVESLKPDQDLATEDWKGVGNTAAMGH
jgi:cytochrome c oxidase cbb3-type subunit 3